MTAIAIQHRESIISQLAQGKRLSDIAPGIDATPSQISRALKSDPDYRDAIESGFHARLDRAEDGIEQASDQCDVARARALFTSIAWRAEREFPERWGAKSEVKHTGAVTVDYTVKFDAIELLNSVAQTTITGQAERIIEQTTVDNDSEHLQAIDSNE